MNSGLWIQYAIVGALFVASLIYVVRKLRASAKSGECAGSCGSCGGGCDDGSDEPAKVAVVTVHPRKTH